MALKQYQVVLRQDGDSAQAEYARKYLEVPIYRARRLGLDRARAH